MDIEKAFTEKITRFEDLKKQIMEINKKIGTLQEEGRVLHQSALEVKGALEQLAALKAEEEAAKTPLTLPDKSLVAADGKTVLVDANATQAAPAAPVALEVK